MTEVTPADAVSTVKEFALAAGQVLGVLLTGVAIGAVGVIKKNKDLFKWNQEKSKKFIAKHSQIHELLTEMRVTVRASRCLVLQFHNGGAFADGTSIKRFSVTHESCAADVTSMILESQDVLLTRYMDLVPLMEEKSNKIIAVSSLAPSAFRSGLEINSVEYFSVSPLKCVDGLTPLGFICCHWCSVDTLDEMEREGFEQSTIEQVIGESTRNINSYLALNKAELK